MHAQLMPGELPPAKKLTHAEVGYESPSQHEREDCDDCKNFIDAKVPRCLHVKSPIGPEDWCQKFKRRKPRD